MKKILSLLVVLLLSGSISQAYDVDLTKDGQYQKKVTETGFKILNSNRIEKRVVFKYQSNKTINAYAFSKDHSVIILHGILPYIDDDAELAGILSHEIAHNIDFYHGFFRTLAMHTIILKKTYEIKADKKAVDYMVKAGYNPVAYIITMNKISGEINWLDSKLYYPKTSKRLAIVYEYIYDKYPAYLVQNEYKENIYYQNFLLTSKDVREKIRAKHIENISNITKKSI